MAHKIKGIKITFQTIVEMLSWILVQPQVPGSSYLLKWCFLKHISQTISSEKSVTCWNAVSNESSIELKILRSSCELSILPSFPDDSDGHKSGNHTFDSPLRVTVSILLTHLFASFSSWFYSFRHCSWAIKAIKKRHWGLYLFCVMEIHKIFRTLRLAKVGIPFKDLFSGK